MIYFIQDQKTYAIKIGFTAGNPLSRLDALQTGNPNKLSLLKSIDGDMGLESSLHEQFKESRINGEWFHPSADLLKYIIEGDSDYVHQVKWLPEIDPLIGLYFHSFMANDGPKPRVEWQGQIISRIDNGQLLVQLYSWLSGEMTILQVVDLHAIKEWWLYKSSDDMNDTYERKLQYRNREHAPESNKAIEVMRFEDITPDLDGDDEES